MPLNRSFLLAEGFHDELLKIAAEEEQAVFVGENDHVLGAFSAGGVVPHEGDEGGGVFGGVVHAGDEVRVASTGEEGVDVDALERGGEETDGGEDAEVRPPTQSPHGEAVRANFP